MQSQFSKKLIKKLAKEHNLPEYKIRDVINSYFGLASYVLKEEVNFEKERFLTVAIPFFGKFYMPLHWRERLKEKRSENI
jgi:hypothetical protein